MKYLHSWLQEYVEEAIPTGKEFSDAISINAFEVEEIVEIKNPLLGRGQGEVVTDFVYEIKILPNRNHDALSHYFMAKEIATIFNLKMKTVQTTASQNRNEGDKNIASLGEDPAVAKAMVGEGVNENGLVRIADSKACTRFMGVKVKNIVVKESPDFIKYRLESIGQKSINNIVDITNYVQFAFNKPMHAYDESKINGYLEARFAKEGEVVTTLDGKELKLDEQTLVIADAEKVLGLAGIKGGNNSGIESRTKNIIVESANFNATLIRKTAQKYDLRTDASKRFENELADKLVEIGMYETLKLIKEYASDDTSAGSVIEVEEIEDNWPKRKSGSWKYKVSVSVNEINKLIGINLNDIEIENIWNRFGFDYKYISTKENLEDKIKEVLGKPYKNPTSMREDAPNAFSCSSLISYLYEGVYMPSISIDKYLYTRDLAKDVKSKNDLRFGDLVFINTGKVITTGIYYEGVEYKKGDRVEVGIDHLGIYLGDDKILHSSSQLENGTEIESLDKFLERGSLAGHGRVLENLEEKRFVITVPDERLDLRIKEDLIEEVARVYGLNNIKSVLPDLKKTGKPHKRLYFENKIKNILFQYGFSEVYNYSLKNKGEIEILKSVAQDKNKLRTNLNDGMQDSVQKNIFNMPLLDTNEIRIFEFGNCFAKDIETGAEKEWRSLCIAIDDGKKNKNYKEPSSAILSEIKKELGVTNINFTENKNTSQKENSLEIDFDELIKDSDFDEEYIKYIELESGVSNREVKYQNFSLMPFIVRDIACFVSPEVTKENIENIIKENTSALCKSVKCFDEFEKEIENEVGEKVKKKSFAFRLIYQDENRTLTDGEINEEADKIYNSLKNKGFEIR